MVITGSVGATAFPLDFPDTVVVVSAFAGTAARASRAAVGATAAEMARITINEIRRILSFLHSTVSICGTNSSLGKM